MITSCVNASYSGGTLAGATIRLPSGRPARAISGSAATPPSTHTHSGTNRPPSSTATARTHITPPLISARIFAVSRCTAWARCQARCPSAIASANTASGTGASHQRSQRAVSTATPTVAQNSVTARYTGDRSPW